MQSLFIEELLRLFFLNCNSNPGTFISNFNESKSIIGFNYRCKEQRFTHVSDSFKTILGYTIQNILQKGNFTSKIVHPQDQEVIDDCLKRSSPVQNSDSNQYDLYQFSQIKCRAKHIKGYWKYFLMYAKGYWNDKDQSNDKIGLIVDERMKTEATAESNTQDKTHFNKLGISTESEDQNTTMQISLVSPRENEVLEMIGNGYLTKEIASKLHISDSTVITHRKNLISKLHVRNTAELIKKAARHMLI